MDNVQQTEASVSEFLVAKAKEKGEISARTIVVNRLVKNPERSLQRIVRIALLVSTNNENLVDALIQECLNNDNDIYFVGSDVNLQSDMKIDYLFFEAKIMAKK